jgi:hypothetical protein
MPRLSEPLANRKVTRSIAAGAAAIALAVGGFAIANSSSGSSSSGTASAAPATQSAPRTQSSHPALSGQLPPNWRPGTGTVVTGAAANQAKAAAVAKYPAGTVNRVLKLSDGSYAVHRIGTPAPHHIFVSKTFKVTGTA